VENRAEGTHEEEIIGKGPAGGKTEEKNRGGGIREVEPDESNHERGTRGEEPEKRNHGRENQVYWDRKSGDPAERVRGGEPKERD
jgi:hypothetical protein